MQYTFLPKGTCSSKIQFNLENDVVSEVRFTGGCNGNLQAVSKLVDHMTVDEIAEKCEGIHCGFRNTSCADQLVKALREAQSKENA